MFDVVWTDPGRETVGARRDRRKFPNEAENSSKRSAAPSGRSSVSTTSSISTHSSDNVFSLFKGIGFKKSMSTLGKPRSIADSTSSQDQSMKDNRESSVLSPIPSLAGEEDRSAASMESNKAKHENSPDINITSPGRPSGFEGGVSTLPKGKENVRDVSQETAQATAQATPSPLVKKQGAKSRVTQTLGPHSTITQTTKVVVEPRTPEQPINGPVSGIRISAKHTKRNMTPSTANRPIFFTPRGPQEPQQPVASASAQDSFSSPLHPLFRPSLRITTTDSDTIPEDSGPWQPPKSWESKLSSASSPTAIKDMAANSDVVPAAESKKWQPPESWNSKLPIADSSTAIKDRAADSNAVLEDSEKWQPPKSWNSKLSSANSPISTEKAATDTDVIPAANSEKWQPPKSWNSKLSSANSPTSIEDLVSYTEQKTQDMSTDLVSLQREIRRMAAAGPQLILSRLTEEWGVSADASLYKELEMERKRWMLSALMNRSLEDMPYKAQAPKEERLVRKVLALFEPPAITSYVAAIHSEVPVYHMAPTPLSHNLFPNIKPIVSPTIPHSTLSVAPNFFDIVHCLRLPALVPASELPQLLRNIGRTLTKTGVLQLVLIDPTPVASSMGPYLQKWMQDHLLINMERQFRCMSPTRLLPFWLSEAKMRGPQSDVHTIAFQAVPGARDDDMTFDVGSSQSRKSEERIRNLARTEVGRLFWQEVWGQYVTAKRWWWEEPKCVAECHELGTHWEYKILEAGRES